MIESLINLQKILCLLTINKQALQSFQDDSSAYSRETHLSPEEENYLCDFFKTEGSGVELLATLLTERREEHIKLFLPHTAKYFNKVLWDELYNQYMRELKNNGMMTPIKEAYHFSNFLQQIKDKYKFHAWHIEIIRYENLKCQLLLSESDLIQDYQHEPAQNLCPLICSKYIIEEFEYNISDLITRGSNQIEENITNQKTLFLLTKTWDRHGVITLKVNNTITELLKFCDGTNSINAIFTKLQKLNPKLEYQHCNEFFNMLSTKKIIIFLKGRERYE